MADFVPQLEDLGDVDGRSVLLRADFNVPIRDGRITDDLRIRVALPTITWLTERGARVTVCTHLGRPKGTPDPKYSVAPVRERLAELAPGVELLENLRYDPGEEGNDPAFVDRLVEGHDLYVNDAFGASHRAHASIVGPPKVLPSAAGRLLAREVEVLSGLRNDPRRPFVAITGGSKVSDKLGVIKALLDIADHLVIGGGMCFTFLAAEGHSIGNSLFEAEQVETCAGLLDEHGDRLHLPSDIVGLGPGGKLFEPGAGGEVRNFGTDLPDGWMGVDIGPGTAAEFGDIILDARTILWNGPMGVFEDPRFEAGTRSVAEAVADSRGYSVIGGGDSAAAAAQFGVDDRVDHVSTGGGASLELIEQGDLPGLAALRGAAQRLNAHLRSDSESENAMATSRTPLISGNWKMHHDHFEALRTVQKLSYNLGDHDYGKVNVAVHPPFTDIRTVQTAIESDRMKIVLGAQNCHWEDKGAFTGEVSPLFLAKLNVSYVIAGHSERRELFGETDETVNLKVKAIVKAGMTPIMCCGETLDEREADSAESKVDGQIRAGLAGVGADTVAAMVIAYEPIWAIGTGRTVTPDDAQAMCAFIRKVVGEVSGAEAAGSVRIQYGGSVKPGNAGELMGQPDIDGALVGGASLDADDFAAIVRYER